MRMYDVTGAVEVLAYYLEVGFETSGRRWGIEDTKQLTLAIDELLADAYAEIRYLQAQAKGLEQEITEMNQRLAEIEKKTASL